MNRMQDFAQRHPRIFAGVWFMLAAVPGPAFFLIGLFPPPERRVPFIALFVVLPLLCAFTAGAGWGVRLYDTRRSASTARAVFQGMGLMILAYLIYTGVCFTILTLLSPPEGNVLRIVKRLRNFLFGFIFFGIPSVLGGGAGGWLLRRLIARKSDIAGKPGNDVQ